MIKMLTKNKKFLVSVVSLFVFSAYILPVFLFADDVGPAKPSFLGGIVTCDGVEYKCDFAAFVGMLNGIINWIIGLAGLIFTISAIYGGFLYITSGINPGNKEKAKSILWNTLIGFVIILTSWLIIYTILDYLVPDDSTIFKFIGNGR